MAERTNQLDLNDLPVWFDIRCYSEQRNLSRRQWGQQIAKRAYLLEAIDRLGGLQIGPDLRGAVTEELTEQLTLLFSNPLTEWMPQKIGLPIQPLSFGNIKSVLANVEKWNSLIKTFAEASTKNGWQAIEDPNTPIDNLTSLDGNFLGHLKVNLLARDPELIESFKTWLQSRRSQYGYTLAKKSIRQNADNEWIKAGLLPFADLRIWGNFKGRTLTQEQTVDLIFPDCQVDHRTKYATVSDAFKLYLNYENGLSLIYGSTD